MLLTSVASMEDMLTSVAECKITETELSSSKGGKARSGGRHLTMRSIDPFRSTAAAEFKVSDVNKEELPPRCR